MDASCDIFSCRLIIAHLISPLFLSLIFTHTVVISQRFAHCWFREDFTNTKGHKAAMQIILLHSVPVSCGAWRCVLHVDGCWEIRWWRWSLSFYPDSLFCDAEGAGKHFWTCLMTQEQRDRLEGSLPHSNSGANNVSIAFNSPHRTSGLQGLTTHPTNLLNLFFYQEHERETFRNGKCFSYKINLKQSRFRTQDETFVYKVISFPFQMSLESPVSVPLCR